MDVGKRVCSRIPEQAAGTSEVSQLCLWESSLWLGAGLK